MDELKHFNIRVYGLLINEKSEVLLSDEFLSGMKMTKYPGGGLQFGEGPEDCLKREAIEEFGQEAEIIEHFYTTGFFQKSWFHKDHQLISIYYLIRLKEQPAFKISDVPFDFPAMENGNQSFRWKKIGDLIPSNLTFPVDRHVVCLLKKKYAGMK